MYEIPQSVETITRILSSLPIIAGVKGLIVFNVRAASNEMLVFAVARILGPTIHSLAAIADKYRRALIFVALFKAV